MRGAPQRGLAACIWRNERAEVGGDRRPAPPSPPRLPRTSERKGAPMPADHGLGRDDLDGPSPVGPQLGEQHPEEAIDLAEPRPPRPLPLEHGELMPQGEDLRLEVKARSETGPEGGDQGGERCDHAGGEHSQPWGRICNDDKTFGISGSDSSTEVQWRPGVSSLQ